jgi:hypothetical protein
MSSLTIPVEIMAGADFESAVEDAKELAKRLEVAYVTFKFNGISVSVSQSASSFDMYKQYLAINRQKHKFIIG